VRGKPTGDNTVSKYPLTWSVFGVTDSRLCLISILLLLSFGFILQNSTNLKRMLLRNLSWSQHGIQMQKRIPPPQSISVVSPNLERILLRNLSWSQHGIQMQEWIPPPQSISVVFPPLERIVLRNLSWSHHGV
jgi:hypothetical protein